MKAMKDQYGEKEGKAVFYASKNKGTIKGVEKKVMKAAMGRAAFSETTSKAPGTKMKEEPYIGSYMKSELAGKKVNNQSLVNYYGDMLKGLKMAKKDIKIVDLIDRFGKARVLKALTKRRFTNKKRVEERKTGQKHMGFNKGSGENGVVYRDKKGKKNYKRKSYESF